MKQYQLYELVFTGKEPSGSWSQPDICAVFTCEEETVRVKGFYDGNGLYKIRFLPRRTGLWKWEVSGVVQASGESFCEASGDAHGLVTASGNHFVYEDGTRYLPFGTTVYAMMHQTDQVIEQTFETLQASPFNKIRTCVFPKHYDLVKGEPACFPFERNADVNWDVNRPDIAFWHRFEKGLERLEKLGIQTDLILFHPYDCWGFSRMTMEENYIYLDLVLRRLAAMPGLWWSLANEYDLLPERTLEDWYNLEAYLAQNDPYGHLLSCHNCTAPYDFHRPAVSHVSIQTDWMGGAASWQKEYGKPVIYDEMCYEGNVVYEWGNLSAFEMVHRFWEVCSCGAYATHGDAFMDEKDIIWWACGGKLKGQSRERIGFLKDILYSLPGCLEPLGQRGPARFEKVTENMLVQLKDRDEGLYMMASGVQKMEPILRQAFFEKGRSFGGHCGEEAYLYYYGRTCPFEGEIKLPGDKQYHVDVIDIWEMSRETVLSNVSGSVKVPLPSKEGIAVLAVRGL